MNLPRIILGLALSLSLTVYSEESQPAAGARGISSVDDAIPNAVKVLKSPSLMPFKGDQFAVSTTNEAARTHCIQGLHHLYGGWEFEASRHFAKAMQKDPDCLIAHWGMVMSLLDATPETSNVRLAALDRLIHLMKQGQGSELERGYTYALLQYFESGTGAGANAFRKVANKFPDDIQAAVLSALFSRGGYDVTGQPTPDQIQSENDLIELMKKHPESTIPLHALLVTRAEALDAGNSVQLARQLQQAQSAYAPAFHILGHYEWRAGNHRRAAAAFGRASSTYQKWMRVNRISAADCPEWIIAECYRVIALLSIGQDDTAYAAAKLIAATPLPEGRPASPGARFLLWDAKTLPARILLRQGLNHNTDKAAKELPDSEWMQSYKKYSLAYWWVDGLRLALEAQHLSNAGNASKAREVAAALDTHIRQMGQTRQLAAAGGESLQWTRAHRALKILLADLRGRIAATGPPDVRHVAYNWFVSAMDHQRPEPLLYPPLILKPMAARLGDYYLKHDRPQDAVQAYQQALTVIPNDIHSLRGLAIALKSAGKPDEALEVTRRMAELQAN